MNLEFCTHNVPSCYASISSPCLVSEILRMCFVYGFNSFVMSVCPSVRPHGTARLPLDGFSWNLVYEYFFLNFVDKIQLPLKSAKNNGYFSWRPMHIKTARWILLRMRNVSNKSCRENRKIQFICDNFFPQIVPFMRECGTRQVTDDNIVQRMCIHAE